MREWVGGPGLVAALALSLVTGPPLGAEEGPAKPAIGVRLDLQSDAAVTDALLPGQLLDWALPRAGGGHRRILLLVSGAEQELEGNLLLELDPQGGPLVELSRRLDAETNGLAALDVDDDDVDEIIVGRPGGLLVFAHPGARPPLRRRGKWIRADGVDLRARPPEGGPQAGSVSTGLYLARLGGLDRVVPDGTGGIEVVELSSLPIRAERLPGGIKLHSPEVTVLESGGGGGLYAIGPESVGSRRLRTLLVDRAGQTSEEVWSALPEPEVVQWRDYVRLNGRPALVVTVNSADKLGIFERQRLRVFELSSDRTRAGAPTILESRTASRRWQRVWPTVVDLNADGADDLVLIQTDGLGGMKLVAEAFLGDGGGGLSAVPRRTAVDRPVSLALFGPDFTGDGAPDLVVAAAGELVVLAGIADSKKRFVEKEPARLVTFTDSAAVETEVELDESGVVMRQRGRAADEALRAVDLDGDGGEEILWIEGRDGHPHWDGGRVRVVRWGSGSG